MNIDWDTQDPEEGKDGLVGEIVREVRKLSEPFAGYIPYGDDLRDEEQYNKFLRGDH